MCFLGAFSDCLFIFTRIRLLSMPCCLFSYLSTTICLFFKEFFVLGACYVSFSNIGSIDHDTKFSSGVCGDSRLSIMGYHQFLSWIDQRRIDSVGKFVVVVRDNLWKNYTLLVVNNYRRL